MCVAEYLERNIRTSLAFIAESPHWWATEVQAAQKEIADARVAAALASPVRQASNITVESDVTGGDASHGASASASGSQSSGRGGAGGRARGGAGGQVRGKGSNKRKRHGVTSE